MNSLFCANFASSRGPWTPCLSVWHGGCNSPHPLDRFFVSVTTDDDGFDWRPPADLQHYKVARNGDHLLTPFQCDLCWFRNLQGRNPFEDDPKDTFLLCTLRLANLDALWGRESQTVGATLRATKQLLRQWEKVGLHPSLPPLGPYPLGDSLGMGVAVAMLLKSLEPGKYTSSHQQFETIRKLRAGYSNVYMASYEGVPSLRTVGGDRVKHHLTHSPTQSKWFERFCQGCIHRMGQDVRQDWAIPLQALHGLLNLLEEEWNSADQLKQKEQVVSLGAFFVIAFCGSFRGPVVFLTDLGGLHKYLRETIELGRDHVIIPLLGRFKGELNSRYHLSPMAKITDSGINILRWVERLVEVREEEGRTQGPAFCNSWGQIADSYTYEAGLIERLCMVQAANPTIIPPDVDIYEQFGISRSFRRGATSVARIRGVDDKVVRLINRWREFESARGRRPAMPMQKH